MRDFRHELRAERCWDRAAQAAYERGGEAAVDQILQNREELVALCEFIEGHRVRSYLEIGAWTGGLVRALHRLFRFDLVAACDDGWARRFGLELRLPPGTRRFEGSSRSAAFDAWRAPLGHVDLVFIDGDHRYGGVRHDWEVARRHPHRFVAFHDIAGTDPRTAGVRRLWSEIDLPKREFVFPNPEAGLDRPTMGIGIVGS